MAIDLLSRSGARNQVAWCEAAVSLEARRAFEDRGYTVQTCTDAQLLDPAYLSGLGAVVFEQDLNKQLGIERLLRRHLVRLLDLDCRVIIRPLRPDETIINNLLEDLRLLDLRVPRSADGRAELPPQPYISQYAPSVEWAQIANFVMNTPAGQAPNRALQVEIEPRSSRENSESARGLIGRAFSDCVSVHLSPLDEGRSGGVRVYKACAKRNGAVGRWPKPYFVKIGPRNKILEEFRNYQFYVHPYIPFHLGPRLVHERCCLGANQGIIVGDYVEESESLRACAFDGRSASAIACLFDRTLAAWHQSTEISHKPFADTLMGHFPKKISAGRFDRARQLGATLDLAALRQLFGRCDSEPVLLGRVHGDLHSANVRVRATDAIVIDFLAHKGSEPLLYEAATLEASLLVDGFEKPQAYAPSTSRELEQWFDAVRPLYEQPPLRPGEVSLADPISKASWLYDCVAQIRRYARQWAFSPDQYAAALALALLFKASKDGDAKEPEATRRAAAYVFAEWILTKTFPAAQVNAPKPTP